MLYEMPCQGGRFCSRAENRWAAVHVLVEQQHASRCPRAATLLLHHCCCLTAVLLPRFGTMPPEFKDFSLSALDCCAVTPNNTSRLQPVQAGGGHRQLQLQDRHHGGRKPQVAGAQCSDAVLQRADAIPVLWLARSWPSCWPGCCSRCCSCCCVGGVGGGCLPPTFRCSTLHAQECRPPPPWLAGARSDWRLLRNGEGRCVVLRGRAARGAGIDLVSVVSAAGVAMPPGLTTPCPLSAAD